MLAVQQRAKQIYLLRIKAPTLAHAAHAGNFVNVAIPHCGEILWRRPFSIHNVDRENGSFGVLFSAIGRGTRALSRVAPGETLDILGLLGNTFTCPADLQEAIIVAGGIGIAPFALLMQDLSTTKIIKSLFYGVGTASEFCGLDEFKSHGAELHLSTEDGSLGHKGLITEVLEGYLEESDDNRKRMIYACGPIPMLTSVQEIAQKYSLPGQVSVENIMACGFGVCMGCPVPMAQPDKGYKLACKDGPVFPLNEIVIYD